ncbi:MAG: hypothetical protein Kow0020_11230 [Wenzhouxiangellaceae bacterium]
MGILTAARGALIAGLVTGVLWGLRVGLMATIIAFGALCAVGLARDLLRLEE